MDWNGIMQAITTIGFPIVMCLIVCLYVKYITDKNNEQIDKIMQQHKEESKEMTAAIENNTIVIRQLLDKLTDD